MRGAMLMVVLAGCQAVPEGVPIERAEPVTKWVMAKAPMETAGDAKVNGEFLVFERVQVEEGKPERGIKVEVMRTTSVVNEPVEAWISMHEACQMEVFEVTLETSDVKILGASRFELRGGERARVVFTSEMLGPGSIRVTTRRIKTCNGVRD